ncbi:aldose epimerase family protein [Methylobacterium oryzihabitans]|uniref:Aldose 1-epimerase n=1 Tax=Methylobacterium oryzihabitans TaxID=2499852 RepID=A0A3S2YSX3_9HYPH|nr:aldose epimerase family protein [Methylobacterium oryzihabitans]RVU18687.1 galactose mutarotase [Methylobacterium oryzihabitans]
MQAEPFGTTRDGAAVTRHTLARGDLRVRILSYGAIVQTVEVPDRAGRIANVVLGLDRLDRYETVSPHFGGLLGRYANRIAGGRFVLDGTTHALTRNEGRNTLHGGTRGFDRHAWDVLSADDHRIVLHRVSPDAEEGFPGALATTVTYGLDADGGLRIDYEAETDAATVVSLSNHSYFNLAGEGSGDVFGHEVTVFADHYLPVDGEGIPTGTMAPVAGTPFDFREPVPLGARIREADPQLVRGQGYDHTFVLGPGDALRPAARVHDPRSGRRLDVLTTRPGLQLYSGNQLDGRLAGPGGRLYRPGDALCLEAQAFPDAPNRPDFPSTVLRPGERFRATTIYRFSVA